MKAEQYEKVTLFAEVLQDMQRELDVSNAKICEKAGIDEGYYSRLIHGKNGKKGRPSREKIVAIGFGLIALDIKPNGKERTPLQNPIDRMNTLLAAEDIGPLTADSADKYAVAVLTCLERKQHTLAAVEECAKQIHPAKDRSFAGVLTKLRNEIKVNPADLYKAAHLTYYDYHRISTNHVSFKNPHNCKKEHLFLLGFGLTNLDTGASSPGEQRRRARNRIDTLLRAAGYCSLDSAADPLNALIADCIDHDRFDIDAVNAYLTEQNAETLFMAFDTKESHYERGLQYVDKKKYKQAVQAFSAAIKADPTFMEAYYERGYAYSMYVIDIPKAIQDFTAVLKLEPAYEEVYVFRGCLYGRTGNQDQAQRDFTEAIRLYPRLAEALMKRSDEYVKKGGEYRFKAIRLMDKARKMLREGLGNAYYHRGLSYAEEGLLDLALKDLLDATKCNPEYATLFYDTDAA